MIYNLELYSTKTKCICFASKPGTLAKFILAKALVQFIDEPEVGIKFVNKGFSQHVENV